MNWLVAIAACSVSIIATRMAIPLARRLRVIDQPNPVFQTHDVATPLLGGAGIIAGTAAGALAGGTAFSPGTLLGAALLILLGAYKDVSRRDLPSVVQLVLQALACMLAVGFQAPATSVLTVLAGIALINAVNFLDVMDALCAIVCAVAAFGLWLLTSSPAALALAAALLGFLVWNRPKARIFMGDIGTFFIGYVLYRIACSGIASGTPPAALALVLAVPAVELVATIAARLAAGRSVLLGDTLHLSLTLGRWGVPRAGVVGAFALAGTVCIALALILVD